MSLVPKGPSIKNKIYKDFFINSKIYSKIMNVVMRSATSLAEVIADNGSAL